MPRSKAQVERFFDGFEIVEPGVVPVLAWRPYDLLDDPNAAWYWAGIARKR